MTSKSLTNAKIAKNDEFYTQYGDIQKEIEAYLEYNSNVFSNKVVYCNCDDPLKSNFFRYFVLNFNKLGLKQLITTYKPLSIANTQLALFGDNKTLPKSKDRSKIKANKFIVNKVRDINNDNKFNLKDIVQQLKQNVHNEWMPLESDGDFRRMVSYRNIRGIDAIYVPSQYVNTDSIAEIPIVLGIISPNSRWNAFTFPTTADSIRAEINPPFSDEPHHTIDETPVSDYPAFTTYDELAETLETCILVENRVIEVYFQDKNGITNEERDQFRSTLDSIVIRNTQELRER